MWHLLLLTLRLRAVCALCRVSEHIADVFAILRAFQRGGPDGGGLRDALALAVFLVRRMHRKLAPHLRVLRPFLDCLPFVSARASAADPSQAAKGDGDQSAGGAASPKQDACAAELPKRLGLPWTVAVPAQEAATKLRTLGLELPPGPPPYRYTIASAEDVELWVGALSSTVCRLEEALLWEGREGSGEPSAEEVLAAAVNLSVLHGLMSSGFYDKLVAVDEVTRNLEREWWEVMGGRYPCARRGGIGGTCSHPVPEQRKDRMEDVVRAPEESQIGTWKEYSMDE